MIIRHILNVIDWLTPVHRKKWAQAMRAEISNYDNQTDALVFALGCLIACCRFHLELEISPIRIGKQIMKDRYIVSAFIAGTSASVIGLAYLSLSGAPQTMLIVNGSALALGFILTSAMLLSIPLTSKLLTIFSVSGALILLGTATFGYAIEGAKRWLLIGPFFIQTSLMLLPLIVLGFARRQNFWTSLAVTLASLAMAMQPDRAMAAMLFATAILVGWMRPGKMTFAVCLFCALAFVTTVLLPDDLPAVPFVDHILWSSFDISMWVGLSLWIGCIILVSPIVLLPRRKRSVVHYAFAICWLALIAAAAMGAYPTPIVGYGASAIIGYFLCILFLRPIEQSRSNGKKVGAILPHRHSDKLPFRMHRSSLVTTH